MWLPKRAECVLGYAASQAVAAPAKTAVREGGDLKELPTPFGHAATAHVAEHARGAKVADDILTCAGVRRAALRPWGDLVYDDRRALVVTLEQKGPAPVSLEARLAAAASKLDATLVDATGADADGAEQGFAGIGAGLAWGPEGPPVAPSGVPETFETRLDARRYSDDPEQSDASDGDDPFGGSTRLFLEHALASTLHVDDKKFAALLARTKVLATKDWRDWDWEAVAECVDVLRRGSSLDDDEVRVSRGRLSEALRTKFARRLGGFFRCDDDEPDKASFANLKWAPDRLFYCRVAGRLYSTYLQASDFGAQKQAKAPNEVATFLLKDRRGQFLQSIARKLSDLADGASGSMRKRASSSAAAIVQGLFRKASGAAAPVQDDGPPTASRPRSESQSFFAYAKQVVSPRTQAAAPAALELGPLDEGDEDRGSGATTPGAGGDDASRARRVSQVPRRDMLDGDAVARGLAREFVPMLLRAIATPQGARLVPPRPGQDTAESTSLQRGCLRSNQASTLGLRPERWSLVQK